MELSALNPFKQDVMVVDRLKRLSTTLIVGGVVLLVTFAVSFLVVRRAASTATTEISSYQDMAATEQFMLQARRHEKDFLLRREMKYAEENEAAMASVFATLDRLDHTNDVTLAESVASVRAAAKIYADSFNKVVKTWVDIGLTEDDGLRSQFGNATRVLEAKITNINELPLMVSLLQMRRNEKDFLAHVGSRESQKVYFDKQQAEYKTYEQLVGTLSADARTGLPELGRMYINEFTQLANDYGALVDNTATFEDAAQTTEPLLDAMKQASNAHLKQAMRTIYLTVLSAFAVVLGFVAATAWTLRRSLNMVTGIIVPSLLTMEKTVLGITAGDTTVRTGFRSDNEFGRFGRHFDAMLDTQVRTAEQMHRDSEQLNNSIIALLQNAAKLSQRDLTARMPVAEDVTGAVSDAINAMADETSRVLSQVVSTANQVALAAQQVKAHSNNVMTVAIEERAAVQDSATQLEKASATMLQVAGLATKCYEAARKAIGTTESAEKTVLGTVDGINSIRETIRETEKRIKRLGERSQEISGVVNLINSIAERTHILALNASMHAASAGEAGRGFAVVANEVQRLAENARDATSKIGSLVSNIQIETADTVVTMNEAITKVVSGSVLAERAGTEMRNTRDTTSELVALVQQISSASQAQASVTQGLSAQAAKMVLSSAKTHEQLESQLGHTDLLVEYSDSLLSSVNVFTLPQREAPVAAARVAAPAKGVRQRVASHG
jgi:methyl-accepting chemotaxis protein